MTSFLRYVQRGTRFKQFADFCALHRYQLHLPQPLPTRVLLHGAPRQCATLTPRNSIGTDGQPERTAHIYATDDHNYAIFLALLRLKEGGTAAATVQRGKRALSVSLGFVNGQSRFVSGYVHLLPATPFRQVALGEYTADTPIKTLCAVPIVPQDLTVPVTLTMQ